MSSADPLSKIAIVGATGNVGQHFVSELLKTGKHTVTVLTRTDSKAIMPSGVHVAKVNYTNPQTLVDALRGQQFLVITMSNMAPPETHGILVRAAVDAGVPYIMPNHYGFDLSNERLNRDAMHGVQSMDRCLQVEKLGASYVAMTCGFWYEWSLIMGEQWFGFDVKKRTVTLFDDGAVKISVSTWEQCARALVALLSLPESGQSPALAEWKNKQLCLASFRISQRDMLDSLHRVLGTTDQDWEIRYEPTEKRFQDGKKELEGGDRLGFAKLMYSRIFFPSGDGDIETSQVLANEQFGLPKEDLDECTRNAIRMVESGWNPAGR